MVKEIWKEIPGYSGYEVSDMGNVRSYWLVSSGRRSFDSHVLKPHKGRYSGVRLAYGERGKRKNKSLNVHVLVALAFLGERPEWAYVCHKNGKRHDNRLENLYYGSPKSNMNDAKRHGTLVNGVGVNTNILKPEHVIAIRDLYWGKRANQRELAELFGVSRTNITAIINRQTWKGL